MDLSSEIWSLSCALYPNWWYLALSGSWPNSLEVPVALPCPKLTCPSSNDRGFTKPVKETATRIEYKLTHQVLLESKMTKINYFVIYKNEIEIRIKMTLLSLDFVF